MKHGDKLFLYTDGVTEAINTNKEMYGEERLLAYLNSHRDEKLDDLLYGVKSDIDRFAGEEEQYDDITMLSFYFR